MDKKFFITFATTFLWATVICAGFSALLIYDTTPGEARESPFQWPTNSKIVRSGDYQLVMFVHPHCPCTRGSIDELAVILTKTMSKIQANVLFIQPISCSDEWIETDTWTKAQRIPNVSVMTDNMAAEAKCFGAMTSGHTMLYDPEGKLLFSGGITISRGHVGSNPGRNSILAFTSKDIRDDGYKLKSTPVFGCSLINE